MDATLTLSGRSKNGAYVMYKGLRTVIRVPATAFPDPANPPASFTASGDFAGPRVKLTAEERKARLKAKPKLTLAEKVAAEEKKIAKLKAKLAAAASAPSGDATAPGF